VRDVLDLPRLERRYRNGAATGVLHVLVHVRRESPSEVYRAACARAL